jgi:hypothetical protein
MPLVLARFLMRPQGPSGKDWRRQKLESCATVLPFAGTGGRTGTQTLGSRRSMSAQTSLPSLSSSRPCWVATGSSSSRRQQRPATARQQHRRARSSSRSSGSSSDGSRTAAQARADCCKLRQHDPLLGLAFCSQLLAVICTRLLVLRLHASPALPQGSLQGLEAQFQSSGV